MSGAWLMATVLAPGASEEMADAEPVLLEADALTVTLTLDSGERITFDREELRLEIELAAEMRGVA
jgi:hypothetical protein